MIDGYGRPSFSTIRRALSPIANSLTFCLALWLGRWDLLEEEEIRSIVRGTNLDNVSIEFEAPATVITAVKSENGRSGLKMPMSLFR